MKFIVGIGYYVGLATIPKTEYEKGPDSHIVKHHKQEAVSVSLLLMS